MTKIEFKVAHKFDDQEMILLDYFRAIFGCTTPAIVIDQKEGRWVFEIMEKRKNGQK